MKFTVYYQHRTPTTNNLVGRSHKTDVRTAKAAIDEVKKKYKSALEEITAVYLTDEFGRRTCVQADPVSMLKGTK